MTKREIDRKMKKNRRKSIMIIAIIAVFIIAIYRFVFLTRTETVGPTVTAVVKEVGFDRTPLTSSLIINEDENGHYILIPEKVSSYIVSKFIKNIEQSVIEEPVEEPTEVEEIDENTTTIETSAEPVQEENTSTPEKIDNTITNEIAQNIVENEIQDDTNTVENEVSNENIEQNTEAEENAVENVVTNETVENIIENTVENNVTETQTNTIPEVKEETNILQENSDNEEITSSKNEYLPNTKYYLTAEEYENKAVNFDVVYNTRTNYTSDGEIIQLYSQELEHIVSKTGTNILIKGNLPYGSRISATEVKSDIENYINGDEDYKDKELLMAYDISILDESGIEFQPKSCLIPETVDVKIASEAEFSGKIKGNIISIKHFVLKNLENEETGEEELTLVEEEISSVKKREDALEFVTDEFSPYAIFSESAISDDMITIDDYDSDEKYYTGLNYTENGTGRATNDFYNKNTNLAKATINYYSFDYEEEPVPTDTDYDTAQWSSTETTYDIISTTTINIDNQLINWTDITGVQTYTYNGQTRYKCTITISFTTDEEIEMTKSPWSFHLMLPNGGWNSDMNEMLRLNSDFTITNDGGGNITVSGANMTEHGWTRSRKYICYTFHFCIYRCRFIRCSSI